VYFGASAAIVVLERLAHTDPDLLPDDLLLGRFEFSRLTTFADLSQVGALTEDWAHDEGPTRRLGGSWLRDRSSCVLKVPSAILPEESNFVFNPRHPDAQQLHLVRERPFAFDPRLV
jgi:RES domain-containing protein